MPRTPSAPDRTGKRFLAASVAGALNTANARKPLNNDGRIGALGFFPGWLTSELPLHAIAWQSLATAVWIRKGALRTKAGWLGLGITGASFAGLVQVWKTSMGAGDVFDHALDEGLRDLTDDGSSPLPQDDAVQLVRRRILAGPVARWRKRYVTHGDLSYGDAGRRNSLDIWARPDLPTDAKAPVLVQVHGGGWVIGNKNQQAMPLMAHMADRGWV